MASRRLLLGVILVVGLGILWWVLSSSGWLGGGVRDVVEPTGALTIAPTTAATAAASAATPLPTATADTPAVGDTGTPTATTGAVAAPDVTEIVRFQIDPSQSSARFIVDEILFGDPNTVIGSTSDMTGTIEIDLSDPTRTQISPIQIDARTLATDNRFRNRSLSRFILQSNRAEYQYITFTPTAITGLPETAQPGDVLELEVTGDLQIRDITQPVTLATTVTATTAGLLTGFASTTVSRADFALTIPEVEGVADVTEEVRLELDFVAVAQE